MWLLWLGFVLVCFLQAIEYRQIREERRCAVPIEYPNFLTDRECRAVIRAALDTGLERSEIVDDRGDGMVSPVRTSSQVFLPNDHPAVRPVIDKAERYLGIPRARFEDLQVVRYTRGQKYEAHYDSDDDTFEPRDLRSDTLLIYLNNVKSGGHTKFPSVDISVKPRKGKAVHWKNVDSLGYTLPCSLHGGTPVTRGEKWICTVWCRL